MRAVVIASVLTLFLDDYYAAAYEGAGSRKSFLIDASSGSVAGVSTSMTEETLRKTGWPYRIGFEQQEGDYYKIYHVYLSGGAYLKCETWRNAVHRISTRSVGVKDKHGLSVGAQLRTLKRVYPGGKFIYGDADGIYANFITGGTIIFSFNPKDLDQSCFDNADCNVDDFIRVHTVVISDRPVPAN